MTDDLEFRCWVQSAPIQVTPAMLHEAARVYFSYEAAIKDGRADLVAPMLAEVYRPMLTAADESAAAA